MSEKKTVNVLAILVGVVAAGVGAVGGRMAVEKFMGRGNDPAQFDKQLLQISDQINRNLPIMVDEVTRLNSTGALPGRKLLYKYTVLGVDPSGFDKEGFIKKKRPELINLYKTTSGMQSLRENHVALSYIYAAENGTVLAELTISPDDF